MLKMSPLCMLFSITFSWIDLSF